MAAGGRLKVLPFEREDAPVPTEATGRCESCGTESDDVADVRRVYVTPSAWDIEERTEVQEAVERWCYACRTHYPHQEVASASDP